MLVEQEDVDNLVDYIDRTLGPSEAWVGPAGYPDGLALCILDSVWSLAANYRFHVIPVLNRYRALRTTQGADAAKDTAEDLVATIRDAGGPAAFADAMGNHQLTSSRSGILKADAVARAAALLAAHWIVTPADLLAAVSGDNGSELRDEWQRIPGQRSSLTGWRYLLLLAGGQEVKPDRMIRRYVADATGRDAIDPELAAELVRMAASRLGVDLRTLDHTIWLYESARAHPGECS